MGGLQASNTLMLNLKLNVQVVVVERDGADQELRNYNG